MALTKFMGYAVFLYLVENAGNASLSEFVYW